jgi:hypothetical protein
VTRMCYVGLQSDYDLYKSWWDNSRGGRQNLWLIAPERETWPCRSRSMLWIIFGLERLL